VHFTPASSSWLNLVECWFSILQRRELARGVYRSTYARERAIRQYVAAANGKARSFVWTKTADEILASVQRFCLRASNSHHECAVPLVHSRMRGRRSPEAQRVSGRAPGRTNARHRRAARNAVNGLGPPHGPATLTLRLEWEP
jgi:hypothetical protein